MGDASHAAADSVPRTATNDQLVYQALSGAHRPLSAYRILELARSGQIKSAVQVYRALEKLERAGRVHRIEALNAYVACRCGEHARKPGFVICSDCGTVEEFEDDRLGAIAEEAAGAAFAIDTVSLEVIGRCGPCREPPHGA